MKYSEKVMDHFTNPRNVGEIEDADGVGVVGNAKCGDIMKSKNNLIFEQLNQIFSAAPSLLASARSAI